VVVISHSRFFYWWPLWAVGFLMAGLTYWTGHQVAFVPADTVVQRDAEVKGVEGRRDILVAPAGRPLPADEVDGRRLPPLTMTTSNNPGIIWAMTLCVLVIITHIELRGVWSVIAILVAVLGTVAIAVLGLWDTLIWAFLALDIHISAAGYLAISLFLFVLWVATVFVYDRREYMIFTRGQLRVRKAVGTGETAFDTRGMVVEKQRDAVFRHWLLGFGSGDLIVNTSGTNSRQFEMPNVLLIGYKLRLIHTMLQEREVVKTR